jgi:glycosyltransferase involved in cell wall biosynthesis
VIPGKVYQILAMARPLIAADTPANRELLTHEDTAYLCPASDAEALAAAILKCHQSLPLREHLAAAGRTLYVERCSETVITERLHHLVRSLVQ